MFPDDPEHAPRTLKELLDDLPEPARKCLGEVFSVLIQELAASWEEERGVNIPQGWAVEMMAEDLAEQILLRLGRQRLASPLFWDFYRSARRRRLKIARALQAASDSLQA